MFELTRSNWKRLITSRRAEPAAGNRERPVWVRDPSDRQTLVWRDAVDAEPQLASVWDVSRGGNLIPR